MKVSKIIYMVMSIFMLIGIANASTFYDSFEFTFADEKPVNMAGISSQCMDSSCSTAVNTNVEYFRGDAIDCWNDFATVGDAAGFNSCMDSKKIVGNIIDLNQNMKIFAKYDTSASFGYVNWFFTGGDTYIPYYHWQQSFICEFDICMNLNNPITVDFTKINNAIAEVGQVNIKNIDNALLPIQIEVPVKIEQTVCSAFRFANPTLFRPQPPIGFSDFSANTLITLNITDVLSETKYLSQAVTIPIEADTCAGLAAFSWTADSSLENRDVKFRVETDVIDGQVSSSTKDWMEVIERIYPSELDGACWTRAYDFTLSNIESIDLTPSVAQIKVGETLYALFTAGGFRDYEIKPMNFEAIVYFNDTKVYDELLYSGPASTEDDLSTYSLDLTSHIIGLDAGNYEVKLVTIPIGSDCTIKGNVEQTQNLGLLEPDTYTATFHVRDPNFNVLEGANVNLKLIEAEGHFVESIVYNENMNTNSNGQAVFTSILPGQYLYAVSKSDFVTVTKEVYIGADTNIYVTMLNENSAPVINLPDMLTDYYQNPITLNIKDYVFDYNDVFEDLVITSKLDSGNVAINYNNGIFTFTTNQPNVGVVTIFAQDPAGAIVNDSIIINFTDNQAPVIHEFKADPNNGQAPFNTMFSIDVSDRDNDPLTCTIHFGDGNDVTNDCNILDGVTHIYMLPGTYNAYLSVTDGVNTVDATEQVFVYNMTIRSPVINSFTFDSSNGLIVPTNLTLNWNVTHTGDYPMTCTLRINGVDTPVSCIDTHQINNFEVTGISRFHIIAIDNASTQVIRTIQREFFKDAELTPLNTNLIIDSVIAPGDFNFAIKIFNETLPRRTINLEPAIVCGDIVNKLDNGVHTFVSRRDMETSIFRFTLNTLDFKLRVPTDTPCQFQVTLIDDFKTDITLNENVVFSYLQPELKMTSIRGKGTDIVDYMSSTLSSRINVGYNTISFDVVNNENEPKELDIMMTSTNLGISYRTELNLAPGQRRSVQIPLFIESNTQTGLYPVRYSVSENAVKQVRYSYIEIKN